jgi:hypothetical protein
MYVTIFDKYIPLWNELPIHTRAAIVGVSIVATTILFGSVAALTHYHYAALIALGIFYGIVISKMMSQFLAPKIQSLVTGFLSGITAGNIGVQQARLSAAIHKFADGIQSIAQNVAATTQHADAEFNMAIVWGMWVATVTAVVILAANAYYANLESSPVGSAAANVATAAAVPPVVLAGNQATEAGSLVPNR